MARYIVTGAPGTGKTTVLGLLQDSITVVPEPARALIAEYRATAGGPTLDKLPDLFVDRLIERSIENYFAVPDDRPALFDRGLPDCVAYAAITGVDPAEAMRQAAAHRYDDPVFMAAPGRRSIRPTNFEGPHSPRSRRSMRSWSAHTRRLGTSWWRCRWLRLPKGQPSSATR